MKTLYISDLDGTLLDKNITLSQESKDGIKKLIENGHYFTAATARTYASVDKIFDDTPVNVPIVLMNGVCIFNRQTNEYEKVYSIDMQYRKTIIDAFHEAKIAVFLYTIEDNTLNTYYEELLTDSAKEFVAQREQRYKKVFTKVNSFNDVINNNWVYISVTEKEEVLDKAYNILKSVEGLHIEYYHDIYNKDHKYLEICSNKASKFNGVNYLKEKYGFEKVIGFGDNLNDIPLAKACDEFYAVCNAKEEVKNIAHKVIGSNDESGVIKYIIENLLEVK